jgi:ribosome-associated protein
MLDFARIENDDAPRTQESAQTAALASRQASADMALGDSMTPKNVKSDISEAPVTHQDKAASPPSPAVVAHRIGDILLDKKASDLVVLNVEGITTLAEYLVVASGTSSRQLQAMANELTMDMKQLGLARVRAEGVDQGWWILIDCGDVVVHLMQEEARHFYNLETLWADGEVVRRSASVA